MTIRNRMTRFAYIVAEQWPDGDVIFNDTTGSQMHAYDASGKAHDRGHEYTVTRIEFSPNGYPVAVADVTADFQFDREEVEDVLGNRVDDAWANAGGTREAAE